MSLDLGALVAHATIDSAPFDRGVTRLFRVLSTFGTEADKTSSGVRVLDDSLVAAGDSATKASTSLGRATAATRAQGASAERAAAQERQHAAATSQVNKVMAQYAGESTRVQAAALRVAAAQERVNAVEESGVATTRQLASAQATLIGAQRSLAAAQEAGAVSGGRFRTSMAGTLKMAAGLGLIVGAFEGVKKAIDIGKEAGAFQRQMLLIETQTGGTTAEVNYMSKAILNLAGKVATSPNSLATSVYHFESIGLRGAAALHAMTIAAEGAKVGNSNLDDTTQALVYTVQSGITGVNGLSQAMGVFNTIVGSGDMTTQQLVEALGSHGLLANAKASGVSIQELGAALAVLGDNGVKGVNAATGITQILNDMLKPAAGGAAALDAIGLSSDELRNTLSGKGLNAALQQLSGHLTKAGITGTKLKGALADMFTKRASANLAIVLGNMDLWNSKLAINTKAASGFDKAWQDTTKNASFAWQQISAKVDAAGIAIATRLLPPSADAARWLGTNIPHALSVLATILGPTVHLVGDGLGMAWHVATAAMSAAAAVLGPIVHFLEQHQTLSTAVATGVLSMWAAWKLWTIARAAVVGISNLLAGLEAKMAATALVPARLTGAVNAAAIGTQGAALRMGASWDSVAVSANASATASSAAAIKMAGAADTAAVGVAGAGETAAVGWTAMLGPLAGIGLGIGLLVSMFHKSSNASKEAADAAKAYTDALSGGGDKTSIIDTITQQLTDNKLPETLRDLNKALGTAQYTGKQFVDAIAGGGKPLAALRSQLEGVVKAGTSLGTVSSGKGVAVVKMMTPAAQAAGAALGHLNTQYSTLTKVAAKDLLDTKTFAGVSSSIDKVSASTTVGTDLAKQYAQMMGIVVDKNGIAAVSSKTLNAAVNTVSSAYAHATAAGAGFLAALSNFAQSAGTAADRAALIAATLKAANGEALDYVSALNSAAVASHTFSADVRSAAKAVGKNGESTRAYLASVVDLKNGTIDYRKAAAGPLISDLQGMQTAAMNAAQATFQNARATMSGKDAADAAYKVYKNQTSGQLVDQLKKLGANTAEAHRLADQYFGMPKNVKTLIEAQGTDPIVTVLNKIGRQLAILTKTPWNPKISVDPHPAITGIAAVENRLANLKDKTVTVTVLSANAAEHAKPHAAGGSVRDGYFTVGEEGGSRGWELGHKQGSNVSFMSNAQSRAFTGWDRVPGFAGGSGKISTAVGAASTAISAVSGQPGSPPIDLSGFTWRAFLAQLHTASDAIAKAVAAGASQKTITGLRDRLDRLREQGIRVEHKLGAGIAREAAHLASSAATAGTTGSAVAGQLKQLEDDLRRAGLPKSFIAGLSKENTAILNEVKKRNQAAVQLTKATQALADARKAMRGDARSFGGAVTGSFDITTAGQDANGRVTRGGIVAADNQAVTRARAFVAGMKKLIGLKVFPNRYLRTLLGAGPTASNLAEVQALAGMPRADIMQLAADNAALNRLGNQIGGLGATRLDQGKVDAAQKRVDHWQKIEDRREARLEHSMKDLGETIVHELRHMHLEGKLGLTAGQLKLLVDTGASQNAKATRSGTRPGGRP